MNLKHKVAVLGVLLSGLGIVQGATAAPKVTIKTTTPAGLKQEIAKAKGKPVFVNFWATWCSGCLEEMPALAKLKKANAGKITMILVASNETATNAEISTKLSSRGHNSTLLFRSDLIAFFDKFAPSYKGTIALPVTMIFDKNGKLVKTVSDEHTQAEYQKLLNPYLK
jgi:cytochrome c biogenesis protein CcmG/thiol:disulfide interchange protein DsbE